MAKEKNLVTRKGMIAVLLMIMLLAVVSIANIANAAELPSVPSYEEIVASDDPSFDFLENLIYEEALADSDGKLIYCSGKVKPSNVIDDPDELEISVDELQTEETMFLIDIRNAENQYGFSIGVAEGNTETIKSLFENEEAVFYSFHSCLWELVRAHKTPVKQFKGTISKEDLDLPISEIIPKLSETEIPEMLYSDDEGMPEPFPNRRIQFINAIPYSVDTVESTAGGKLITTSDGDNRALWLVSSEHPDTINDEDLMCLIEISDGTNVYRNLRNADFKYY